MRSQFSKRMWSHWAFGLLLALALIVPPVPALAATLAQALGARIERGLDAAGAEDRAAIGMFYDARAMAPLWVGEREPGARAKALADLLAGADLDGLDPLDYHVPAIRALIDAGNTDVEALAELELHLTSGLIRYVSDLGEGRTTPHAADPKLYVFRDRVDPAEVLRRTAASTDLAALVEQYRPQNPRYRRLKEALAEYRAMAARGGWPAIPEGPALKPDMRDPRVPMLRARLRLWGDLKGDGEASGAGDPEVYGPDLVAAVERMQWRHGLDTDGVVGAATLKALNVSAEDRVRQLVLNMERRRWLPDNLGQRYIFVNLADFALKLVDEPKTLLDMPVVVGKTYFMTPIFSADMTYLEINPQWNVPPSIAKKEILPKLRQDVSYLARNKFTLFSDWGENARVVDPATIDWALAANKGFPYKLRQEPGEGNALGRIKFMLPNHFNVYLHDTPAKSLFKKSTRTFSHGCIRVSDPLALAEAVLAGQPGWTRDKIEQAMNSGERRIVTLARPLPVHIGYLTAYANKDGSIHFREDIYGRDALLARVLLDRPTPN
jgi:murein L,D-transpeptidase YcbB/YkuD